MVFDVDVVGGCNIKKFYGDRALSVFIQPPSVDELRCRLEGRGTDAPEVIESRIAKGLALGASSHGVGTAAAIQLGAVEGALSGLAIGLMGIMTAVLVPVISYIITLLS